MRFTMSRDYGAMYTTVVVMKRVLQNHRYRYTPTFLFFEITNERQ